MELDTLIQQFPLRRETIDIITKYSGTLRLIRIKANAATKLEILEHSKYLSLSNGICCSGHYGDYKWNLLL